MTDPSRYLIVLRQNLVNWRFDAQLADLVRACEEFGINEVLLFPHGAEVIDSPTGYWPLDQVRADCALIAKAKTALARIGVQTGLNIWHTLGHGDRGRDMTGRFPFQPLVDPEGRACRANACPLCPEWQQYMTACFEMYAAIKPSCIFLDDDFRWHNHGTAGGGGQMTCFCPLHLAAFNRRYGSQFTRESLVQEILRPGMPSPVRAQWLDFQRDTLDEAARLLGDTVRRISPETEMGLMSGNPDYFATEGRDWGQLLEALCGRGRRMLLRPSYPDYMEGWQRDIPKNLFLLRHSLAQLPRARTMFFPELDNCIPTRFNRSPEYVAMQTMLCAALGIGQFHYSLFEFMGNPDTFTENRVYGEMLRQIRPHIEQVLALTENIQRECGIQFLNHPRSAYSKRLTEGRDWLELLPQPFAMGGSMGLSTGLQWLGFPVTYEESPVVAVCGGLLDTFDDARIELLLAKSLLLDSTAAEVMLRRGFGPQIGLAAVRLGSVERALILGEKVVDPTDPYCGHHVRCRGLVAARQTFFRPLPKARLLTTMVGYEGADEGAGTILYQNDRGGKVAVLNATASELDHLTGIHLTPMRQHLIGRVMEFLHGTTPWVSVRNGPLAFPLHVTLKDGSSLVAVCNAHSGTARALEVAVHNRKVRTVTGWIFADSEMRPARFTVNEGRIVVNQPVPPLGIAILKLT